MAIKRTTKLFYEHDVKNPASFNLRRLRKQRGLTLEELALKAGTDAGNLSRVERHVQRYTPEMLEKLAEALQVPVADLFKEYSLDEYAEVEAADEQAH